MKNKKKLIISILIVAITIFLIYLGLKANAKSTKEMLSEGNGLPSSFPYITYEDLINENDTLCCGKGIPLIGGGRTVVSSGGHSQSEPTLTANDIGRRLFEETQDASGDVTSDSFANPYTSATSHTYAHYAESEMKVATPEEAYILAEISENYQGSDSTFYNVTNKEYTGNLDQSYTYDINGTKLYGINIDTNTGEPKEFVAKNERDGKYYYVEITDSGKFFPYTYVQYAWWKTEAGGNSNKVESTPFSKEAEAFEAYINKVAKRDSEGKIVYETRKVTVNGKEATVQAPVIDYKVTGDDSKVQVQYDEDHERFLIGPFKLNYYEESVTTERGTVDFSRIINCTLTTNLGITDTSKWFFKYENRQDNDKAVYPHNGENFYIVLDYAENLRYISDLRFDFEYMNAGGNYTKLTGEYFEATWEPQSNAIWCDEGARNCPCGGHHTSAIHDEDGNVICSGGAKACSHGYYHNHVKRWEYWLELADLTPGVSQPLAQVYVGVRWLEKAQYSFKAEIPGKPEEYIRLTFPIAGEVWIDSEPDKKNPDFIEGKREDSEKGYKNAEVYIYKVKRDKNGKIVSRKLADVYAEDNKTKLKYPIYTDENGHYEIPNITVPGEGKSSDMTTKDGYHISYDVEFKYDGQHYEASMALPTSNGDAQKYINASKAEKKAYEKDSIASEDPTYRDEYNKKFTETYGGNSIDKNGNTVGYSTNGKDTLTLDYTSTEFSIPNNQNKRRLSTLKVLDDKEHIIEQYKMIATTGNTGVFYPVDNKISVSEADDVKELSVVKTEKGKTTTYKTLYDYMFHINLGVKEREKTDLSVFKDLYKAEILVNEKEITKKFNKYVDVEEEANKDALEIQIEACRVGKYHIGLYSSDYEYRSTVYETSEDVVKNIKADTDLKVYLTYRIAINNESQAKTDLLATVNQINDYYDKSFTYIGKDVYANVLNDNQDRVNKVVAESPYYRIVKKDEQPEYTYWSDNMTRFNCNDNDQKVNKDYKRLTITELKDKKLSAGEQLEMFITFEVDQNGYKDSTQRPDLLGEKNNIAEIANYSTYYTNGKVAGIIDRDSAPDNIDLNRNVKEWYEDDTESAPATNIELFQYNREVNGNVWEDQETVDLLYGQKVANGLMENGEKPIKDIDVQLVEKIQIDGIEYEKVWTEDDFNLTADEKSEYRLKDVTTDENGYYYFKGVLAGNYVVRFKYGNKEATVKYNGQDYKNTAYQAGMKNEDGTTTLNNEWQDLKTNNTLNQTRVSDARDYELQRMKVVAYSRFINNEIGNILESADQTADHKQLIDNTQMVANTAKLNIEIEHQDYIDYGTVRSVDGLNEFTYKVNNIDFGLERRSGTAIDLEKRIENISLYKDDGSTMLLNVSFNEDGTINTTKTDSQYVSKVTHLDEQSNRQGFEYIPMEDSYKNGATLKITYQIKVTNNSEVDWTGKLSKFYDSQSILDKVAELEKTEPYVSGEMLEYGEYVGLNYYNNANNESDKIVKTKVEKLVDYIDNDLSSDEEANSLVENASWVEASLDDLRNNKVLDENVYTDVNGEKMLLDSKNRNYITSTKSNVLLSDNELYNPSVITEFVPAAAVEGTGEKASGEIRVVTTKQLTQNNSDNDIYNNIAEIVSFSNTVGRRDELAVPANAQIRRGEYIAATGYENGELVTDYNGAKEVEVNGTTLHLNGERDTDSPNLITVTEPTGISSRKYNERRYAVAIVISGVILVAGIVVIKKKIIK